MVSFDILVQTVAQTAKAQLESTKKEKEKKKKTVYLLSEDQLGTS